MKYAFARTAITSAQKQAAITGKVLTEERSFTRPGGEATSLDLAQEFAELALRYFDGPESRVKGNWRVRKAALTLDAEMATESVEFAAVAPVKFAIERLIRDARRVALPMLLGATLLELDELLAAIGVPSPPASVTAFAALGVAGIPLLIALNGGDAATLPPPFRDWASPLLLRVQPTPALSASLVVASVVMGAALLVAWLGFSVAIPAVVAEGAGPSRALRRSWQLTRGFKARIAWIWVILGVLEGFAPDLGIGNAVVSIAAEVVAQLVIAYVFVALTGVVPSVELPAAGAPHGPVSEGTIAEFDRSLVRSRWYRAHVAAFLFGVVAIVLGTVAGIGENPPALERFAHWLVASGGGSLLVSGLAAALARDSIFNEIPGATAFWLLLSWTDDVRAREVIRFVSAIAAAFVLVLCGVLAVFAALS